ncbi:hypothetical protein B4Q13_18745 [Lacticaseibacillus rhamnosus]
MKLAAVGALCSKPEPVMGEMILVAADVGRREAVHADAVHPARLVARGDVEVTKTRTAQPRHPQRALDVGRGEILSELDRAIADESEEPDR